MKKVLSIFMAILMVVTMFSFSTVAFAEGEAEAAKEVKYVFIGSGTNYGLALVRVPGERIPVLSVAESTSQSPWNFHVFNPETPVTGLTHPQVEIPETVGTAVIDKVNEYAASGTYSKIVIKTDALTDDSVKIYGLKGTEECPIVIISKDADKEIPQLVNYKNDKTNAPVITLDSCEYVTVESINVTALAQGIVTVNCKNVAIKNVAFTNIGYVDYLTPESSETDEEGNVTNYYAKMDVTPLLEKGPSVYVGAGCDGVTVENCSFTKCRAGVVAHSVDLAEGETESTGIEVLGCTFTEITDVAVYAVGADDVVVSGGTVTNSGTLANAEDWDGSLAVAFYADDAQNITIEKVYSTDNAFFLEAYESTGRVRYNVSARDGGSIAGASELLVYNNTFVEAAGISLDAVVRNNIFQMNMGEKALVEDGDNNCYHWTSKGDRGSIRKNPWFANAYTGAEGTDVKNNYILATGSPCLGKGEKVEDNMGEADFYGNKAAASINIGADAYGTGAEATQELPSQFIDLFNYIIALISNFFANLFA